MNKKRIIGLWISLVILLIMLGCLGIHTNVNDVNRVYLEVSKMTNLTTLENMLKSNKINYQIEQNKLKVKDIVVDISNVEQISIIKKNDLLQKLDYINNRDFSNIKMKVYYVFDKKIENILIKPKYITDYFIYSKNNVIYYMKAYVGFFVLLLYVATFIVAIMLIITLIFALIKSSKVKRNRNKTRIKQKSNNNTKPKNITANKNS